MSDETDRVAEVRTSVPRCDHICLKEDGHVERGEPHFYGYEVPSPRDGDGVVEEIKRLRIALLTIRANANKAAEWIRRAVSVPVIGSG